MIYLLYMKRLIRKILKEEIEFNYSQDDLDRIVNKWGLNSHSKYKEGESVEYYKKHFIDTIKKYIVEGDKIILYRVVAVKSEKDIRKPFGNYWSFEKYGDEVIDWESIEYNPNDLKIFRITALFNLSDINWYDSFDMYLYGDFNESELRVLNSVSPEEYFIEEI